MRQRHRAHLLSPAVVAMLGVHRERQEQERAAAPWWESQTYEGEDVHLVFTTLTGGLALRQAVAKVVKQAARTAGVAESISTHDGRRSVVTAMWVDGGESLDDIAEYVGHADAKTTGGSVKRRGRRQPSCSTLPARVRNQPLRLVATLGGTAPIGGDRAWSAGDRGPRQSGRRRTVPTGPERVAEGMGFEPMVTRRPQRLSRPPHSSALATFRGRR
jgi:hypothetical protein